MKNPFKTFTEFYKAGSKENAFRLDGAVPLGTALPFGVQHLLALFVSNITPILIVLGGGTMMGLSEAVFDNAVRGAIFIAGLATLINLFPIWRIGARLPIYAGTSFIFMGVLALIGASYGLGAMYLSIIIGGLLAGVVGLFAHKWSKFVKPVVASVTVIALGISLIETGVKNFFSFNTPGIIVNGHYDFGYAWPFLLVAALTLITVFLWETFVKGFWKNLSLLAGLFVGYVVSLCFIPYNNMVDFSGFSFNSVTDFINVPLPYFTLVPVAWTDFQIGPILTVFIVYIAAMSCDLGAASSLCEGGLSRPIECKELAGTLSVNGFASALGGFFGAMPLCVYAQNVGIVTQTKVVNRFALSTGAILLILSSLFPPVSRFLQTIPEPVVGGMMLLLFVSICVGGFSMLKNIGFTKKNIVIVAISILVSFGIYVAIEIIEPRYDVEALNYLVLLLGNPVAIAFLIALILSFIIPEKKKAE